jgi:hypothetical protein
MADRRGAANLGIPLMLGTLVLLGGFLYWLATTAEPTPPPAVEEEAPEDTGPVATPLNGDSVSVNGPALYGRLVRIENVAFGQPLGETTFLINSMQPFVGVMGESLVAAGQPMPSGTFTMVGTLMERTDSVLAAWLESGAVTSANEIFAEFASEYVIVDAILPSGEDDAGEGSAGDDGMEQN